MHVRLSVRSSQEMIRRAERFTLSAQCAGVTLTSSPAPAGPTVNGMPSASGHTSVQTVRSGVRSPLHRTTSLAAAAASASPPAAANSNCVADVSKRGPSDGALKRAPSDHLLRSALTPRSAQANHQVSAPSPRLACGRASNGPR